jgi:glycosyltransferase involved in cell wall biosynthesis/CDP-glycerol glycerophosphotransferase (TagB/SpsB family)
MTTVSVIIPVYNVEKYLKECLDSVINQTLKDIEIICVNDASPDNSATILDEYAKKDSRIKVITHDYNQGLGPARNTGVACASSPYVSFIDADDNIAPTMLEVLFELIESNNAEMAWCGTAKVSETGLLIDPGLIPKGVWSAHDVLNNEKFYPSIQTVTNKLFWREFIKEIKQLPILIEDEPAIAEYLGLCKKIVTTSESYYYYRHTPESLSNPSSHKPLYWNQFFNDYEIYFRNLKKNFPQSAILRKHSILRHLSLLWRIKTYNLLKSPFWNEQEREILFHLKQDGMQLKKFCPVMYKYLLLFFKFNWNPKLKEELLEIAMKLVRSAWLKRCSYWLLPIDMFKAEWPKLKNLIKNILDSNELSLYKITGKIFKLLNHKPIWLVGERDDTAQENGYYFYKYIKQEHPEEKSYYIIDKNCSDYKIIKNYANIINYNSLKHKILFFASKYYVTAHNHFCFPVTSFKKKRIKLPESVKNVFLDHGITYADVSDFYGKKNSKIDLFICGAKAEYDHVKKSFGYKEEEVAYTGFARFDGLHNFKTKKQILLMPTWRWDLYNLKKQNSETIEVSFKNSDYYRVFKNLINNSVLISLLTQYDYQLVFSPHYEIQSFLKYFSSVSNQVIIASKDKYIVQDLLKESALLITDTSSISFDFAYMFKPVIYFRFDKDDFSKTHYKPGYFEHETMGFGEVVEQEHELIKLIECYLKNGCQMEELYSDRVKKFYPLHDERNCERIYNAVLNKKLQN